MVVDFVPNSSRKKLLIEFTTLVPTTWEIITKKNKII
jgi:hypothetical protein